MYVFYMRGFLKCIKNNDLIGFNSHLKFYENNKIIILQGAVLAFCHNYNLFSQLKTLVEKLELNGECLYSHIKNFTCNSHENCKKVYNTLTFKKQFWKYFKLNHMSNNNYNHLYLKQFLSEYEYDLSRINHKECKMFINNPEIMFYILTHRGFSPDRNLIIFDLYTENQVKILMNLRRGGLTQNNKIIEYEYTFVKTFKNEISVKFPILFEEFENMRKSANVSELYTFRI